MCVCGGGGGGDSAFYIALFVSLYVCIVFFLSLVLAFRSS